MSDPASLDIGIRALFELGADNVLVFRRDDENDVPSERITVTAITRSGDEVETTQDTADECVVELARKLVARRTDAFGREAVSEGAEGDDVA
jgi:hypothetical protein